VTGALRRRALLRLAGAAAALAGGCAERGARPAIRMGIASAPQSLDPFKAADAVSDRILRLVHGRLVAFDERFMPVPAMVRWRQLEPRRYRLELQPDRRPFSDGRPPMAADVAATLGHLRFGPEATPHKEALAGLERIEVAGAEAVDCCLRRADVLFPGRLDLPVLPAEHVARAGGGRAGAPGSGPFRLAGGDPARALVLERRVDACLLHLEVVADPTVRALKLALGEIDLLQGDLPGELVAWLDRRPGVRVASRPGTTVSYIGFNLQDPLTGDLRLRRAMAAALDRERIIRHLLHGAARPAAAILPPEHWAGLPGGGGWPWGAAAGRAAPGPGRTPVGPVRFRTSTDPGRVRIAQVLQQQLAAAGIGLELRSTEWGTFFADIRAGRFQSYSLSWVGLKLPDALRYIFHSASVPPAGANRGRFADQRTDALLAAAARAPTLAAQAERWRAVQRRLLELLPFIPLWFEDVVAAMREDLSGYELRADGAWDALAAVARP